MNVFLEHGQADQAVVAYRNNVAWFRQHAQAPEVCAAVKRLGVAQYARHAHDVDDALRSLRSCSRPAEVVAWTETRESLQSARSLHAELVALPPFGDPQYRPAQLVDLRLAVGAVEQQYKNKSLCLFMRHAFDETASFFVRYPLNISPEEFFATYHESVIEWINGLCLEDVLRVQKQYGQWLPKVCRSRLAARVFALDHDPTMCPGLQGWMHSFGLIRDMGLADSIVPELRVAFVHATSPVAFARKMIAFPVAVRKDMNVISVVADDERPYADTGVRDADVVVAVAVLLSRCGRFVENCEGREYVNGMQVRTMTSDDFGTARKKVLGDWEAGNTGDGGTEGYHLLERAEDWFFGEDTKEAADEKGDKGVWYRVCDVECDKTATVQYCVYDRASRRMFNDYVDIRSLSGFQVACKKKVQAASDFLVLPHGTVDQKTVVDFETEPVEMPLSMLFADAVTDMTKWRHADLTDMERIMNASMPVTVEPEQYDVLLPADKRFASIIQVEAGCRKGSGFYIDENLVLTSLRVVSGREMAAVWLRDGSKVQGTVVARDARAGLALVRVQRRGVPVRLRQGQLLPAGERVMACGYARKGGPTALPGVIGAVRKYCVGEQGAGAARVVQTDCPFKTEVIGGPLFLGNEVIGITCNAQSDAENGLSLAVHYSEIIDFIRHAGFDYVTGGE